MKILNITEMCNPLRVALKHSALAVAVGAWLALTASAHAEVIISDTFAGTPDGPSIVGRDPETSLSGGKWVNFGVYTASFQSTATVGFGNPINGTFGQSGQNVSAVSIASAGAYVKPTVLTISADLVTSPPGGFASTTGPASLGRGVALGFYSSPSGATDFSQNLFTGLVLDSSGNLNLVNDPNATGFFDPGSFKDTPIAYVGTWDPSAMHRLSYTVDTMTGAISNISLEGSTASYSFTTSLFTDPATALAGVYVSSDSAPPGGTWAGMDNFKVEGIPNPNTPPPPSMVTPVAVTAQSNYDPRPPICAIDGSGMAPNNPVTASSTCATSSGDGTMWLSNNTKSTWITFDQGSVKTLSGFRLWNYNEVNLSNRGVKTADIYIGSTMPANGDSYESQGPAWGTLAESFTFTQGPGADGYLGKDYTFAAPVTGRYIQIYVTSGFAGADAYTGISEIRFYDPSLKADMLSFGPGATIGPVVANEAAISWAVPSGSDLATLAPTFTLSPGATCTVDGTPPVSGETRNFTTPVHYIVKAWDFATSGTTTDYTVTVRFANALNWNVAGGGDWDVATTANWVLPDTTPATFANNDEAFFNNAEGGTINIVSAVLPSATTIGADAGDYVFSGAPLAGTGSLTMNGLGVLTLNSPNTYSGATVVNAGTLKVSGNSALGGSTSFTVADGATLLLSGTGPWPANAAPLAGAGTVSMPLGGQTNVGLNFNMSAFTGILNLSGGLMAVNPYYSPGLVSPVNGTINVENNTTLYLGWQDTTFTTTVKLSGGTDNGEGFGVLRGDAATLNGAVILATNSKIGSAGGTLTLNAVISDGGNGFGFTTVGGGSTVILTAANTYSGPTIVNSGTTLQCNTANSLGGGALEINGKVNLNFVGTKTVASLSLAGIVKPSGVYGSSASTAPLANQDDARFAGTGTVTVDNSGFVDWSIANAPGQTPGQDHDNDVVDNGMEYFMGQTGSSFTAMPGLDGTNTVTWTKDPAYEGTWQVQTSPDLSAWTNVAGTDNGTSVSYTLPSGAGALFVRLLVTPAP